MFLSDHLLVMHDCLSPGQIQELEDLLHHWPGVQNKLFIVNTETMVLSQLITLGLHGRNCSIPLSKTLAVRLQVKASDCDFASDNRVHSGSAIPHHEEKLPIWEKLLEIGSGLEGKWVLITESI